MLTAGEDIYLRIDYPYWFKFYIYHPFKNFLVSKQFIINSQAGYYIIANQKLKQINYKPNEQFDKYGAAAKENKGTEHPPV